MDTKTIGFLLVVVGIGLAAASGARNVQSLTSRQAVAGKAAMLGSKADAAHAALCKARSEAKLPDGDGCASDAKKAGTGDRTRAQTVAAARADLTRWRASTATLSADLVKIRTAFLDAFEAAIEPRADAAVLEPAPTAGARLSGWFGLAGLPFLLGIGLLVGGGLMARKAVAAAATALPSDAADGQAVDFGAKLEGLHETVRALSAQVDQEETASEERLATIKEQLEGLQYDEIEPLVEARMRLQVRIGMAAFASVFSPFSAGERNLNRAWCAAVDHHWPEVKRSIAVAASDLSTAVEELAKVT